MRTPKGPAGASLADPSTPKRPQTSVVTVVVGRGDMRRTRRWAVTLRLRADGGEQVVTVGGPAPRREVRLCDQPEWNSTLSFTAVDLVRARLTVEVVEFMPRPGATARGLLDSNISGRRPQTAAPTIPYRDRTATLGSSTHSWVGVGPTPSEDGHFRTVAVREERLSQWMARQCGHAPCFVSFRDSRSTTQGRVSLNVQIDGGSQAAAAVEADVASKNRSDKLSATQVLRASTAAYIRVLGYATDLRETAHGKIMREAVPDLLARVVGRYCNVILNLAEKYCLTCADERTDTPEITVDTGTRTSRRGASDAAVLSQWLGRDSGSDGGATVDPERVADVLIVLETIVASLAEAPAEPGGGPARGASVPTAALAAPGVLRAVRAVEVAAAYQSAETPSVEHLKANFTELMAGLKEAERLMTRSNEALWKTIRETNKMLKKISEDLKTSTGFNEAGPPEEGYATDDSEGGGGLGPGDAGTPRGQVSSSRG